MGKIGQVGAAAAVETLVVVVAAVQRQRVPPIGDLPVGLREFLPVPERYKEGGLHPLFLQYLEDGLGIPAGPVIEGQIDRLWREGDAFPLLDGLHRAAHRPHPQQKGPQHQQHLQPVFQFSWYLQSVYTTCLYSHSMADREKTCAGC